MPSLIDLRRRIRAVKSTQQITKAMKMIAASRLRRAQERVVSARPFAQKMLKVLNGLASRVDQDAHPLLRIAPPGQGRPLLIVITADRGLCGSFNSNIIKAAGQFVVKEGQGREVALGLIGRKGPRLLPPSRVRRPLRSGWHLPETDVQRRDSGRRCRDRRVHLRRSVERLSRLQRVQVGHDSAPCR